MLLKAPHTLAKLDSQSMSIEFGVHVISLLDSEDTTIVFNTCRVFLRGSCNKNLT